MNLDDMKGLVRAQKEGNADQPYFYYHMLMLIYGQPRPVDHDRKHDRPVKEWDAETWLGKLEEELQEVREAPSKECRTEELLDIITVCTSWLEAMGVDLEKRLRYQKMINVKNEHRGYFKEL